MRDTLERRASHRKGDTDERQSDHSRRIFRNELQGQSAWERHQAYVQRYRARYGRGGDQTASSSGASSRNDWDVLRDSHRFLREDDGPSTSTPSYDDEVARKYYQSLFKDMVLADLKHYKSGKIALRWRSEDDVVAGVGQFTCANTRCQHHRAVHSPIELTAYEVNFAYVEPAPGQDNSVDSTSGRQDAQPKNALVKVVLCRPCSRKLRYKRDLEKTADDGTDKPRSSRRRRSRSPVAR